MTKFIILIVTVFLMACGPLPRPFIDQEPQNNTLLQLAGTQPLSVEPPVFNLQLDKAQLSELTLWSQNHLSKAMRDEGLPAANYTSANNSLHIYSTFIAAPKTKETSLLTLKIRAYEIQNPSKTIIHFQEQISAPARSIKKSPKPLLTELIKRASRRLSQEITALNPDEDDTLAEKKTLIVLLPLPDVLDKATRQSLKTELRTSLRLKGFYLAQSNAEGIQYNLKLEINRTEEAQSSLLKLKWSLFDFQTGEIIGEIVQTNPVPKIPISRIIRPASEAIAEGTAIGIENLVQQKSLQNQAFLK